MNVVRKLAWAAVLVVSGVPHPDAGRQETAPAAPQGSDRPQPAPVPEARPAWPWLPLGELEVEDEFEGEGWGFWGWWETGR